MSRIERITEVINGTLDLNHLAAQVQAGWKLVAVEWHREVSAESVEPVSLPSSRPLEEIPYGLRVAEDCHTLEIDPLENQILIDMMNLMVQDLPLSRVASDLNANGYRTRSNELWTMASVFNMLPRLIEVGPRIFSSSEWEQRHRKIARAR
jgi:Recombinase